MTLYRGTVEYREKPRNDEDNCLRIPLGIFPVLNPNPAFGSSLIIVKLLGVTRATIAPKMDLTNHCIAVKIHGREGIKLMDTRYSAVVGAFMMSEGSAIETRRDEARFVVNRAAGLKSVEIEILDKKIPSPFDPNIRERIICISASVDVEVTVQ